MDKKLLSIIFSEISNDAQEDILIEILSEHEDIELFHTFMSYSTIPIDKLWALIFFGGAELHFIKGIIHELNTNISLTLKIKWIEKDGNKYIGFYSNGICIADNTEPENIPNIMRIVEYSLQFMEHKNDIINDKPLIEYLYTHLKGTNELEILSNLIN